MVLSEALPTNRYARDCSRLQTGQNNEWPPSGGCGWQYHSLEFAPDRQESNGLSHRLDRLSKADRSICATLRQRMGSGWRGYPDKPVGYCEKNSAHRQDAPPE